MKLILMAGACIVWGKKTLILQQSDKGRHPGKWGMPGGKATAGELPVKTALREIKEETGLDVDIKGFIQSIVQFHPNKVALLPVLYHAVPKDKPEVVITDPVISDYKWVSLEEIKKDKYPLRDPMLKDPLIKSLTQKPLPTDSFEIYNIKCWENK
jgi:8-oxo-dGTP pyrophosphatase MutT (NUDIX family)